MDGSQKERNMAQSSAHSLHLMLLPDADDACELWLPRTAEGFWRFSNDPQHRFLSISAKNEQWVATCKKPAFFKNVPLSSSYEIPLEDGMVLQMCNEERSYLLLAEQVIPQRGIFHNYSLPADRQIVIGSKPDCDICYDGPCVAGEHAVISRVGGQWKIRSLDTEYGLYINNVKKIACDLQLGDVIMIMGLKMIVGPGFLSVNSGMGTVKIDSKVLEPTALMQSSFSRYYEQDGSDPTEKFFNRAPRKRRETAIKPITVEGPPMSMNQKKMPMVLRMGGSMVMGGMSALAGNFMMLITSVLFPFMSSRYTEKQQQEYEKLRVIKYTEYLENKEKEIIDAIRIERDDLNQRHPVPGHLLAADWLTTHMWERRPNDSDFLQLRLGTGTRPLSTPLDYPQKSFELQPDELEQKMYQLVERPYTVDNAPIVLSLTETYICGLQGEKEKILDVLYDLVLQTAVLHSYDEVKMVFLLDQESLDRMDAIRYLPHVWDDQRTKRYIATNEAEAYAVGECIKNQGLADEDGKRDLQKILKTRPYYIIFALNQKLFDGHEVFKKILQADQNPCASVITAHGALPKESQKIITLESPGRNICTTMGTDGGEDELFAVDEIAEQQRRQTMRTLANTSLKKINQAQTMPKMVTFLEMFKVGRVEQLNPLKRWQENNPTKSMAAPVGVGEDGTAFMLDLHEKRQGPHGLVAGMTGSGKSEFLITYILSMAVNYHPDEVAFVLIDYKGGGLADAFENPRTGMRLPHLAGTITNLDGGAIHRSLMSIESELIRRQKVFSKVAKQVNEGSMNIYTYQKLYRAGKVTEPLPHLFIISDEFAELKQQQPEFMDKLISAARIGRSLGVHLILATQKPSGVVNDQIRSNTKFRACLRVQDRTDSMDMLKRPEAAELTDTGRFYLQVGYNEYFALGQSAWCGADYEPQETVPTQRDDAVEFIDLTGQVVAKNKPAVKKTNSGMKQIVAVVQYLSDLAKNQNIQPRNLWVEPLPAKIEHGDLAAEYGDPAEGVTALIGLADDPMRQAQMPMCLDLMSFHHMALVGLAGTGKSNFFKAMLYSLVMKHTPEEVNFYILDLSSGVLSAFKNMPHCGAYLTKENEQDFDRLLALIQSIVAERKKQFADADVFSYDDYLNIRKLPLVLVILDGWTNIHDFAKGQQYALGISKFMREAANYGVRFLFSVNHTNELSSKVNQELDYKIALQAKDKFEYNDILSLRNAILPPETPGRGLYNLEGRALEYQVALPYCKLDAQEQMACLQKTLEDRSAQLRGHKAAKSLPMMDDKLEYTDFSTAFDLDRIPLGFSVQTMQPVAMPLQQLHTMSLYFGNPIGVKAVLFNLLTAFRREDAEVIVLRRASGTVFDREAEAQLQAMYGDRYTVWDTTAENVTKLFNLLIADYIPKYRVPYRDEYCQMHGIPATDKGRTVKAAKYIRSKTKPMLVLFESFVDLITADKQAVFADVFGMLRGFNIYFAGGFYPDDSSNTANRLFLAFNKDDFSMLFGGQFHKQWITSIPLEYRSMEKVNPSYNRFVMKYRNVCHRMVMPCGELISTDADPDEKDII